MTDAPAFNLPLARLLADGAATAYTDAEKWQGAFIDPVRLKLATAYVATLAGTQYVLCRGTASIEDCLVDINAPQVPNPRGPGKLHAGFAASAGSVYEAVKSRLFKDLPTVTTGHSKGAAEAAILGEWLAGEGYNVQAGYDFGRPRYCNVEAVQAVKVSRFRMVDRDDAIPHSPPRILLLGLGVYRYEHCGTAVQIRHDGTFGIGEAVWQEMIDQARCVAGMDDCFKAHGIGKYQAALGKAHATIGIL